MSDVNVGKVKSNIFEMVDPDNLYQIPKRLIYLKQLRYEKKVYGGHLGKWSPTPSGAKSKMALCPYIFVMMKSKCVPNFMLVS